MLPVDLRDSVGGGLLGGGDDGGESEGGDDDGRSRGACDLLSDGGWNGEDDSCRVSGKSSTTRRSIALTNGRRRAG